jgi:hypothetical protein
MIQCRAAEEVGAQLPVAADDSIPLIARAWGGGGHTCVGRWRAHARSDSVLPALQAALLAS